ATANKNAEVTSDTIAVWDVTARKPLFEIPPSESGFRFHSAQAADGTRIASQTSRRHPRGMPVVVGKAEGIVLRDGTTGERLAEIRVGGTIVGFAGPEKHLVTVGSGTARVATPENPQTVMPRPDALSFWDSTTGARVKVIPISVAQASA